MPYKTLPTSADDDRSRPAVPINATEHRGPFQIVFPPDQRARVTPTTSFPWNSLGQLIMMFPNGGIYSGTGVVIDNRHVLTAAHNVFSNQLGGFATQGVFLPARDGTTVHDSVDVNRVYITEDYHSLSPAEPEGDVVDYTPYTEDYAVVRLSRAIDNPTITPVAASDHQLDRATVVVAGYPGDKQPPDTLWTSSGNLGAPDDEFLFYQIDTYRGQSGAPVLLPRTDNSPAIVGVHVGGSTALQTNFAVRLTPERVAQIATWVAI